MGNYFGKKKENPNFIDESGSDTDFNHRKRTLEKPTVYRPQIFIDYYKSKLYKVSMRTSFFSIFIFVILIGKSHIYNNIHLG